MTHATVIVRVYLHIFWAPLLPSKVNAKAKALCITPEQILTKKRELSHGLGIRQTKY